MGVLPFPFLHVILRFRERGDHLIALPDGVPAAMIEVQVSVDDDVDVFRRNARRAELLQQLCRLAVDLDHSFREFVAHAGFDQHGLRPGAHHDRVQSQGHQVVGVRFYLALPQAFGDDAEHASAIEVVNPVGDGGQFEIAQGDALHANVPSLKAYH